ncbi:epigen [Elgaria multicarinata webbii]|uniref:epigen n=1 Tax=Elgaria multicarinata webbii TaxID=159646 RepID=UPI002FCD3125
MELTLGYVVEDPMYLKSVQFCLEEHNSYCLNGICIFHKELNMPTCRCLTGFSGERCEHLMLNSYAQYSYENYIAAGIGVGILLIGIFTVIYCYIKKRYRELQSSCKVCHEKTAL